MLAQSWPRDPLATALSARMVSPLAFAAATAPVIGSPAQNGSVRWRDNDVHLDHRLVALQIGDMARSADLCCRGRYAPLPLAPPASAQCNVADGAVHHNHVIRPPPAMIA